MYKIWFSSFNDLYLNRYQKLPISWKFILFYSLDLNFTNVPELFVDYQEVPYIQPGKRMKVPIYFRPKQVREYEFKLQFWVNSLCEEIVTIKGEGLAASIILVLNWNSVLISFTAKNIFFHSGIPLLFDLYEGCQKSFDLGPVKVGEKIVRTIEVMNHSKIAIDATFIFRDMYPIVEDTTNSEATSVCLSPSVVNLQADTGPSR